VREGRGLILLGEGEATSWQAGQEIVLSETEAAALLRGKGCRGFELIEVIDDPPAARKNLPG
jgi:hypothetical protein